jgi:hypothetical protein
MWLKKGFRKGCQVFVAHIKDETKDILPSIEYHSILKDFGDVFGDIPRFPSKRDIDFSIDLVLGASLVSKIPYRMGTLELKKLEMQLFTYNFLIL